MGQLPAILVCWRGLNHTMIYYEIDVFTPNLIPFSWLGHQVAALMITILGVAARGTQNTQERGHHMVHKGLDHICQPEKKDS